MADFLVTGDSCCPPCSDSNDGGALRRIALAPPSAGSRGGPDGDSGPRWEEAKDGFEVHDGDIPGSEHLGGMRTAGQWHGITSHVVRQNVWIYEEGWTRPRCEGIPDTWRFYFIDEVFRVDKNGSTPPPAEEVQGREPGGFTFPTRVDYHTVLFDRRKCDLCIFRFYFGNAWWMADATTNAAVNTLGGSDYAVLEAWATGEGCLFTTKRGGTGSGSSTTDGPAGRRTKAAASGWAQRGPKHYSGYFGSWSICPCSGIRFAAPGPSVTPGIRPEGLIAPITGQPALGGSALADPKPSVRVSRGFPKGGPGHAPPSGWTGPDPHLPWLPPGLSPSSEPPLVFPGPPPLGEAPEPPLLPLPGVAEDPQELPTEPPPEEPAPLEPPGLLPSGFGAR